MQNKGKTKILCIGNIIDYRSLEYILRTEVLKGNIDIQGLFVPNFAGIKKVDDFRVMSEEDMWTVDFDYCLVFSDFLFEQAINFCAARKKGRERVLTQKIFLIPNFDFADYIRLYESNISIVANTCWGGILYNALGMQFRSPFINMYFDSVSDYLKIAENLDYYLSLTLEYKEDKWEENRKCMYPVMTLGDIVINCNHYDDATDAITKWNRRAQRFNKDNIFVECKLDCPENAERFIKLPYRKVGFADFVFPHPEIIDRSVISEEYTKTWYNEYYKFVNYQAELVDRFWIYNVFRLLDGEQNYLRI